jgi:prepilin-type processing-associated H-X9-DG protein
MSLFTGGALEPRTLAATPRTATWLTVSRLDLSKIMPIVREIVDRVADEYDKDDFELSLATMKKEIGLDLEKGLLDAFGDQWLIYGDFSAAGPLGLNFMLVNFIRDGDRLKQSLGLLESKINEQMAAGGGNGLFTFEIKSSPVADTTVSYLNFPMISPAWSVYKDRFYLSLSPAAVRTRIGFDQVQVAPITDSDDFKMMRQKIGRDAVASIAYADLRQTAPQIIGQIAMYAQLMAMQIPAPDDGEARPPFDPMRFIPAMEKLLPHLGPTMSVSWLDDSGIHSETATPFPGADIFSPAGGSSTTIVAGGAMGVGIMLPSLSRAREIADRTVCSANLSGMYKAAYVYSITHKDKFPPNMATMVQDGSMGVKSLGCQNDVNFDIDTFPDAPLDDPKVAAWIDEHASYVYLGGTKTAAIKPDDIFAYEKIGLHGDEGINICFGDGHVEFQNMADALQTLKKAGIENPVHGEQGNARGLGATNKQSRRTAPKPGNAYFYDVVTKEYFTDSATKIPPIKSPAGNEAVRAHFFTCGQCTDEERFIGYYEKYTSDLKKKLEKDPEQFEVYEEAFDGRLYSADGEHWVKAESPEGFALIEKLQQRCPAKKLRYCPPK